eukprot:3828615-Prymnesium_polylepis.1
MRLPSTARRAAPRTPRACSRGHSETPLHACRRWVERVVIGLSLCPWARPANDAGTIRYVQTDELLRVSNPPEATIDVAPDAFADDFLELCAAYANARSSTPCTLAHLPGCIRAATTWSAALRFFCTKRRSMTTTRSWDSTRIMRSAARMAPTPGTTATARRTR